MAATPCQPCFSPLTHLGFCFSSSPPSSFPRSTSVYPPAHAHIKQPSTPAASVRAAPPCPCLVLSPSLTLVESSRWHVPSTCLHSFPRTSALHFLALHRHLHAATLQSGAALIHRSHAYAPITLAQPTRLNRSLKLWMHPSRLPTRLACLHPHSLPCGPFECSQE